MGWGHSLQCYFGLTTAHKTLQSLGKAAIFCRNARVKGLHSTLLKHGNQRCGTSWACPLWSTAIRGLLPALQAPAHLDMACPALLQTDVNARFPVQTSACQLHPSKARRQFANHQRVRVEALQTAAPKDEVETANPPVLGRLAEDRR